MAKGWGWEESIKADKLCRVPYGLPARSLRALPTFDGSEPRKGAPNTPARVQCPISPGDDPASTIACLTPDNPVRYPVGPGRGECEFCFVTTFSRQLRARVPPVGTPHRELQLSPHTRMLKRIRGDNTSTPPIAPFPRPYRQHSPIISGVFIYSSALPYCRSSGSCSPASQQAPPCL